MAPVAGPRRHVLMFACIVSHGILFLMLAAARKNCKGVSSSWYPSGLVKGASVEDTVLKVSANESNGAENRARSLDNSSLQNSSFVNGSQQQTALSTPSPASTTDDDQGLAGIVFCVVSAERVQSYLVESLISLDEEIKSTASAAKIDVNIVDVSTNPDRADIKAAKQLLPHFQFPILMNKPSANCSANKDDTAEGRDDRPPCIVRQQTLDVAAAMEQCSRAVHRDGWVILVEDDSTLCKSGLRDIIAILQVMMVRPALWNSASFASFFSGVSIPKRKLSQFTSHIVSMVAQRPVDHAIWDAWAEGKYYKYEGNLFSHKGKVSVFQYRNAKEFRDLYDEMRFSDTVTACRGMQLQDALSMVFAA